MAETNLDKGEEFMSILAEVVDSLDMSIRCKWWNIIKLLYTFCDSNGSTWLRYTYECV